jgi:hypothetical protein
MNPDPRFYLSARRPNGDDDSDPVIAAALQQTSADPQLASWADAEKRQDAALASKLRSVPPPAGLRERILAGAQLRRPGLRGWFEQRAWRSFRNSELVAAAAIALLFALVFVFRATRPGGELLTWQEAAAAEVATIERAGSTGPLDYVVNDLPNIRAWLSTQTCPSPASLPPMVRKLPIYGCAKREWRGQPLSIVCFAFAGGREIHLVTIERKHLPDAPPEMRPIFGTAREYQTASWSEGTVSMMLIGKVERAELETLFHLDSVARAGGAILLLAAAHR